MDLSGRDVEAAGIGVLGDLSGAHTLLFDSLTQDLLVLTVAFSNTASASLQTLAGLGSGFTLANQGFYDAVSSSWVVGLSALSFGSTSYTQPQGFFFPLDPSLSCFQGLTLTSSLLLPSSSTPTLSIPLLVPFFRSLTLSSRTPSPLLPSHPLVWFIPATKSSPLTLS